MPRFSLLLCVAILSMAFSRDARAQTSGGGIDDSSLEVVAPVASQVLPSGTTAQSDPSRLRDRLIELEKQRAELERTGIPAAQRKAKADALQAEIARIEAQLAGKVAPADLAVGRTVDLVQKYGSSWILEYLTHGQYTGKSKAEHSPLEAVNASGKAPDAPGKAALPIFGYPLNVIMSNDPICREAYQAFIPKMEEIVREMEKKSGKRCEFFDTKPTVTPNDVGWDVDRFWAFAQECARKSVGKYFAGASEAEIQRATDQVALVICSSFLSNVSIDLTGDKESQTKTTFWRGNAAPWFNPDKSDNRNRFHIYHFFTHAWLTYLKLNNSTRYGDGKILTSDQAKQPSRLTLANARAFSTATGLAYEAGSTVSGTQHGFLEGTPVDKLPEGTLKRVAKALHLKSVPFNESASDMRDNREGADFGAALFLKGGPLKLSQIAQNGQLVSDWKKNPSAPTSTTAQASGPSQGQSVLLSSDRVSLNALNAKAGQDRIRENRSSTLFRGTGSYNDPKAYADAEARAFRTLMGEEDSLSYNLRKVLKETQSGSSPSAAYQEAKTLHAGIIQNEFNSADAKKRSEIFKGLYSNEWKPSYSDKPGENYNYEADFVYTTWRSDVAGCYGPIVLGIKEQTPRGIDLNNVAKSYSYYSATRTAKDLVTGKWRTVVGDYILDDDEYIIPSYIPSTDVVSFDARRADTKVVGVDAANKDFKIALKAPPVQRHYEKKMVDGYLVIDAYDGQGKLIERMSEAPSRTPVDPKVARSSEKLPDYVAKAWKAHVESLRGR